MANINLAGVYLQMQRRFTVEGAGLGRFEEDFIAGVNSATRIINRRADLAVRIDMVDGPDKTIALDDAYLDVLMDITAVYMARLGQRPAHGDEANMIKTEADVPDLINSIRQDLINRAQEADADDTVSRVGLGALGN